jgi:hypothetical protein
VGVLTGFMSGIMLLPPALDGRNLLALCEECHAEQHRTKRWRCDALGHINLGGD